MKLSSLFLVLTFFVCGLTQAQTPQAKKRLNAELLASDGKPGSALGSTVAVNGNIVAVGTALPNSPVYLFSRLSKGIVNQIATLSASDGALLFSVAVGNNGSLVVAGAINETVGQNPDQGIVYVFEEPQGGWTGNIMETAKLTASDGGANDFLGSWVSTTNGTIVAGADGFGNDKGKAYVYLEPQGGWANATENAQLTASNGRAGDAFGVSVSIEGPRIVVGASENGGRAGMLMFSRSHEAGGRA
jgi:hypothetical protein